MGVEPTGAVPSDARTVLKTAEPTGTQPLPRDAGRRPVVIAYRSVGAVSRRERAIRVGGRRENRIGSRLWDRAPALDGGQAQHVCQEGARVGNGAGVAG